MPSGHREGGAHSGRVRHAGPSAAARDVSVEPGQAAEAVVLPQGERHAATVLENDASVRQRNFFSEYFFTNTCRLSEAIGVGRDTCERPFTWE